ncbi:MAG: tryptophan--tRNA ligase [Desulfovibrionaceae bacterium]
MQRCVSGMRTTGSLHLGHYFGVLNSWLLLQDTAQCSFFLADLHALTTDYAQTSHIEQRSLDLLLDWLASGLDPNKCTIFKQSAIKEHAELSLYLSMITPLSWLERNPTYKDVREASEKDINTFGFLGYPVLMTADIILYKADIVPVGEDQLPHLELSREITRRFTHFYGECFPQPKAYITQSAKCIGLDGRKMSKSYNNAIFLRDSEDDIEKKVRSMITDSSRVRKTDKGDPKRCLLFPYHELLSSQEMCEDIATGCTEASLGCSECKGMLIDSLSMFLEPMRHRYQQYTKETLLEILHEGNAKARSSAEETMKEVREKIGL